MRTSRSAEVSLHAYPVVGYTREANYWNIPMKYLVEKDIVVAWFAHAECPHKTMAEATALAPDHAGYLQFRDSVSDVRAYGRSGTLGLKAQPFAFPQDLYVGLDNAGYPVLSNNREVLSRVASAIVPAEWVLSDEGLDGNLPVSYPTMSGLIHSVDLVNLQ